MRRAHVGVQVEVAAQGHVDRTEATTDRRGQRALQGHLVAGDRIERGLRQQFTVLLHRGQPGLGVFVLQAGAEPVEHVQGRVHDLRADAIAADDRDLLGHCVGGSRRAPGREDAPGAKEGGKLSPNYARSAQGDPARLSQQVRISPAFAPDSGCGRERARPPRPPRPHRRSGGGPRRPGYAEGAWPSSSGSSLPARCRAIMSS